MDANHSDEQGTTCDCNKYFAGITLCCGIIGICSFLLLFIPLVDNILHVLYFIFSVTIAGLLSGIIALVLIYRSKLRYIGEGTAWIGLVLCTFALIVAGFIYELLNAF